MNRYLLLALCGVFAHWTLLWPAVAENISTAKTLGLAATFTLCGDSGGQKTCTEDKWVIAVKSDGWETQVTSTLQGGSTLWSESCKAGQYAYQGAGVAWKGACKLSGDAKQLCFHTDLRSHPTPGMTALTDQCFTVMAKTCTMTMKGKSLMLAQDGVSILNTFDTYAEKMTECHVIGTLN